MIKNRTIFTGDNLDILRGMDSESIDLVYLDPPFNSNKHYSAPIGSQAAGAEFKDAWTFEDTDAAWWGELSEDQPSLWAVINAAGEVGGKGDKSYLIYMAMRLLELHRVLKITGSIYLHCDPTMSHSLKMVMDAIFGKKNFRNEIIWCYDRWDAKSYDFQQMHDVIFRFAKSDKFTFNVLTEIDARRQKTLDRGYTTNLINGFRQLIIYKGSENKPNIKKLMQKSKFDKIIIKEQKERPLKDYWMINIIHPKAKERTGYPTQKPLSLLKRIILSSCPEGGIVLDPFCGCATTCIASEYEERQWIGIDISEKAVELVKLRAEGKFSLFPVIHRTDIPTRNAPPRSENIKHILFGNQEGLCRGCKVQFPFSNFTLDHIIPTSKGGADTNGNIQLLCSFCNSVKGNRPMEYLLAEINKRTNKNG